MENSTFHGYLIIYSFDFTVFRIFINANDFISQTLTKEKLKVNIINIRMIFSPIILTACVFMPIENDMCIGKL